MPKQIEVATIADLEAIERLSIAGWDNREPGYQIDDVNSVDQLFKVFDIIRSSAPTQEAREVKFSVSWPQDPAGLDYMSSTPLGAAGTAHVDGTATGMAVNQNIRDELPVLLGFERPRFGPKPRMKWPYVDHLRVGYTKPGRLTVFSEGGYDWLRQTAHQFKRPSQLNNEWVRYVQNRNIQVDIEKIKLMASTALERVSINSIAQQSSL
jgi:hypothetical protein